MTLGTHHGLDLLMIEMMDHLIILLDDLLEMVAMMDVQVVITDPDQGVGINRAFLMWNSILQIIQLHLLLHMHLQLGQGQGETDHSPAADL